MHFLKSPSFKLLLLTVWENNQIQIIYSLMYHQNTCNAHMLLWSSRNKINLILKILTEFYCAVFSFDLLRFFPNLTVWMSIVLNFAAWLRVPCAWKSWHKCSEMCLRASRQKSHAIPLKNGLWKHRFGAVLEHWMLIIPSEPDYAFQQLWG